MELGVLFSTRETTLLTLLVVWLFIYMVRTRPMD
jgi:hypothetical protein